MLFDVVERVLVHCWCRSFILHYWDVLCLVYLGFVCLLSFSEEKKILYTEGL